MKDLARSIIKDTAQKAGLDSAKVYELVAADNLTIKRPYMTIQFLPENYKRTGRKLAVTRTAAGNARVTEVIRKKELYEVELLVAVNILAEDEKWLADFCYAFVAAMPRGLNDERGNWVKIRAEKAQFAKLPDTRVGESVIKVFNKCGQLYQIAFTGRIVEEIREPLIPKHSIEIGWDGYKNPGVDNGKEQKN